MTLSGEGDAHCRRTAVGFFDTVSDFLNDVMFRSAKEKLGFMVEISGSGALIETDIFLNVISKLNRSAWV